MSPCAPIAQLDRAVDYESTGREFESLWAHHNVLKIKRLRKSKIDKIETKTQTETKTVT